MAKLLGFSLGLCVVIAIATWAAHTAGQMQTIPNGITQLRLLDCAPPCWVGIVPGQTLIGDAKAKMIAAYVAKNELSIRDSGFADGPVFSNTVENTIEGGSFSLSVRLETSALVDGKSETVQAIGLSETRGDKTNYAPTVADVLGTFGPPEGAVVDPSVTRTYTITLVYRGMNVAFNTYNGIITFAEFPSFYLENQATQPLLQNYRPWKGFGTIALSK